MKKIDGNDLIKNQIDDLIQLVCSTSLWAPKEIVDLLLKEPSNKTASWFNNTRRFKARNSEKRRSFDGNIYLDDNVCANVAIKKAVGLKNLKNFHTCHIYDKSTYDIKYHTSIPNLILVPSCLYAVTDNSEMCKAFLKYISYRIYGFYIDNKPDIPVGWDESLLDKMIKPSDIQIETAKKSVVKRKRDKKEKQIIQ